ncbi:MAG: NADH-quinone oxidoreductase subunit J [Proteobacteria bacterium]|nr:NADH-quinone oxidoreductase subunit J [Pseudomonadota bacterium]MBK7114600.1 NADH-quinone oxidoreductase subunit J [Pseudomonadota bacterium]MBK9253329.1 NADH-quinone oxidoreductase subunit J [Pseudomonadota bacterium]MCC6632239.1 NADH-quinone oxidoreductase subunit J [Gammaproteobacteria bacterium]
MLVNILFYAFALVLLASAIGVIGSKNPVHSALCLVLTFFTAAAIWLLAQAEFLAIVLVLVYVGAVMVLFLFVVMMLDIDIEKIRSGFTRHFWLGIAVAIVLFLEIVGVVVARGLGANVDMKSGMAPVGAADSNATELGTALYTKYVYPFELAAVLLLVAIIAAIVLTMRQRKGLKVQDIGAQVATRREDRLRILQMPAEKKE